MHSVVDLQVILVYGEKIYLKNHSRINSNIHAITLDSSLIKNTNFIGTSQAGIAGIVYVSINNTVSIDPAHGAKSNEPSWALLPIPATMTQTMHLCTFRSFIYVHLDYLKRNEMMIEFRFYRVMMINFA